MADTENKEAYGINRQAYPIPTDTFPGVDTFDRFVFGHQIDHSLLSNSEIFEQHGTMSNKKLSSLIVRYSSSMEECRTRNFQVLYPIPTSTSGSWLRRLGRVAGGIKICRTMLSANFRGYLCACDV